MRKPPSLARSSHALLSAENGNCGPVLTNVSDIGRERRVGPDALVRHALVAQINTQSQEAALGLVSYLLWRLSFIDRTVLVAFRYKQRRVRGVDRDYVANAYLEVRVARLVLLDGIAR